MSASARAGAVVLLYGLVGGAVPAFGQTPGPKAEHTVNTSATATVYVKPNAARLTFAVTETEVMGKSVQDAMEKRIKTVKNALSALPLNKDTVDVQVLTTTWTSLVISQPNAPGVLPQGKRAQSTFTVTVREKNLEKLRAAVGLLAETAIDNGGTAVEEDDPSMPLMSRLRRQRVGMAGGGPFGGAVQNEPDPVPGPTIEWLANDTAAERREAIRRAVKEAMADAQAAVGDAKLTVINIQVTRPGERMLIQQARLRANMNGGTEGSLVPVQVEVFVTCSY